LRWCADKQSSVAHFAHVIVPLRTNFATARAIAGCEIANRERFFCKSCAHEMQANTLHMHHAQTRIIAGFPHGLPVGFRACENAATAKSCASLGENAVDASSGCGLSKSPLRLMLFSNESRSTQLDFPCSAAADRREVSN
jgi:hypothetical protein